MITVTEMERLLYLTPAPIFFLFQATQQSKAGLEICTPATTFKKERETLLKPANNKVGNDKNKTVWICVLKVCSFLLQAFR